MSDFNMHTALMGRLRRMHHIYRFSSLPVIKQQNVAAHSWEAAMIGYLIYWDLMEKGTKVDLPKIMARLIIHDISECMSGDVIRSYKYRTPDMQAACEHADIVNTYDLTREFGDGVGDHAFIDWGEAKDDSLEGEIVRLADALCVVAYCIDEWHMGNARLDGVLMACYEDVIKPMQHPLLKPYIYQMFPNEEHTDVYRGTGERTHTTWTSPRT